MNLENVKVGDTLIHRYRNGSELVKVTRLTKIWVYVTGNLSYRKKDGNRVGCPTWHVDHVVVPVEGEVKRFRAKVLTDRLRRALVDKLQAGVGITYSTLLGIEQIIKEDHNVRDQG